MFLIDWEVKFVIDKDGASYSFDKTIHVPLHCNLTQNVFLKHPIFVAKHFKYK